MRGILLLMMGGSGTRLGADIPKQYIDVDGRPVFYYIARKYATLPEIAAVCIVSHPDWLGFVRETVADIPFRCPVELAPGGATRSESVRNGLRALKPLARPEDPVLIHDATHPYVDVEGTREVIRAVNAIGGATLGACQYDTCYRMDGEQRLKRVIPRRELVSGASPEAFRYGDISRIYFESTEAELESMTSAGAIALAHGIPMKVVPARVLNLKITYPQDLALFRLLVHTYFFKEEESEER